MPRPPAVPLEAESRLVLAILAGELSVTEAARKTKVWAAENAGRPLAYDSRGPDDLPSWMLPGLLPA